MGNGEVDNLLRTCYGETVVMDFGRQLHSFKKCAYSLLLWLLGLRTCSPAFFCHCRSVIFCYGLQKSCQITIDTLK